MPGVNFDRMAHFRRIYDALCVRTQVSGILLQALMTLTIEFELETDGRWIAEIPQLPGVLAYGDTQDKAAQHARALAFRVLADQIESGEIDANSIASVSFAA
jgi:predicted RNase H-like HicB family nuclease